VDHGTRLVVSLGVRLLLIGFAGWFALADSAVPGAPLVTRIGLACAFLILAVLVGEVSTSRVHLGMLLSALRQASPEAAAAAGANGDPRRDDRAAVDALLAALRVGEPETRAKAHRHLVRITGQDLPPDPEAWDRWWATHREGFRRS
jgi:hypothetical protein